MILLRHGQSEFNAIFSVTRRDPGIPDPKLTPLGRDQAAAAARTLKAERIGRILVSPYTRALETATIVAEALGLGISAVTPLVRERYAFACDIGSPTSQLAAAWPGLDFAHLPERWWPETEEPAESVAHRARTFRAELARRPDWGETLVVSHWGFILGLTGMRVQNCEMLRCDPTTPHPDIISWHH
jgi:broad specificity phosphatase PhoE